MQMMRCCGFYVPGRGCGLVQYDMWAPPHAAARLTRGKDDPERMQQIWGILQKLLSKMKRRSEGGDSALNRMEHDRQLDRQG